MIVCVNENMLLCFSSFFTYVQILIALVFAISTYSWPTNIITHFMICYILRYIICSNKKILMEMYNYKTIHFMYEVWYMYVYSCSEGREDNVPPSQCLTIRVLSYLFYICIYYVCSHYYTHTNGYRTHTIIAIKNIVGCKINCV